VKQGPDFGHPSCPVSGCSAASRSKINLLSANQDPAIGVMIPMWRAVFSSSAKLRADFLAKGKNYLHGAFALGGFLRIPKWCARISFLKSSQEYSVAVENHRRMSAECAQQ
jgi:hypothetical protein